MPSANFRDAAKQIFDRMTGGAGFTGMDLSCAKPDPIISV
jgi:hypothetical protein